MKWYDALKAAGPFSWISWIISAFNKNDKTFSKIGEGVNSAFNKFTGAGLTGAEQEANRFTQGMAEQAHQWDVENYKNRYQWEVESMQNAGLNPAVMYGSSTGSGSVPSSPVGSSVSPTAGFNPIDAILQLALAKSQIENVKADTEQKRQDTAKSAAETERIRLLTPTEKEDLLASIDLKRMNISEGEARIALDYANVGLLDIDAKTREAYNNVVIAESQSRISRNEQENKESEQRVENLKREYAISFAEEAAIKANTGMISQQTKNLLVENGILVQSERAAEYEANIKQFEDDKKAADRVWRNIHTGVGIFRDAGIGVAGIVSAFTPLGQTRTVIRGFKK